MFRKLTFVFLTVYLLTACLKVPEGGAPRGTSTPAPVSTSVSFPLTLTDDLGRTVTLAHPAQRVVSLAPSNTEILFAVGAGAQVVGRDETSDYPAEAQSLPTVGGWSGFSKESIVALQPDLVLGQGDGFTSPELVASLEALGLTVYVLPNPLTIEAMYTNLETVAALTGHAANVPALVDSLKVRVAALDARIAAVSARPTVYYETGTEPSKSYTVGPGSFIDGLLTRAGGKNAAGQLNGQWLTLGFEEVIALDPQIIILGDASYGESAQTVAARPGWDVLSAVKNGMVFPIDDNLISRPGPRLVDGLEALAKLLHPGL